MKRSSDILHALDAAQRVEQVIKLLDAVDFHRQLEHQHRFIAALLGDEAVDWDMHIAQHDGDVSDERRILLRLGGDVDDRLEFFVECRAVGCPFGVHPASLILLWRV